MLDLPVRDRDNVEPGPGRVRSRTHDVIARRSPQRPYLVVVDGPLRSGPFRRTARLDFDEHQKIGLPRDDIDLASALRGLPVAGDHRKTMPAQKPVRQILAVCAKVTVPAVAYSIAEAVERDQWVQT